MTEPSAGPKVEYYGVDRYWNELPQVIAHQSRLATGSEARWWTTLLKEDYAASPRRRGLVMACGNGWLERHLMDLGLADEIDAFDVDAFYVAGADEQREGRAINYFVSDFQSFVPRHRYDIIINHAALHHAQWLYRHVHRLAEALEPGGVFANWDYIGTDRNQYSEAHLAALRDYNESMPTRFRTSKVLRPSLAQAIDGDPTEAIHASEIVRALENEFDIEFQRNIGGGLAYSLLWNNIAEFEREDEEASQVLRDMLAEDERLTRDGTIPVLFSFIIARPRTGRRRPRAFWDLYVREPVREWLAEHTTKKVYPREILVTVRRHGLWRPAAYREFSQRFLHPLWAQRPSARSVVVHRAQRSTRAAAHRFPRLAQSKPVTFARRLANVVRYYR